MIDTRQLIARGLEYGQTESGFPYAVTTIKTNEREEVTVWSYSSPVAVYEKNMDEDKAELLLDGSMILGYIAAREAFLQCVPRITGGAVQSMEDLIGHCGGDVIQRDKEKGGDITIYYL